jgi:hypothetical protein
VYNKTKPDSHIFEELMDINLHDIPHTFHYIQNAEPAAGITDFLFDHRTDMLALIERPGNLLIKLFRNSVTNQLALSAKMPMLVMHS